MSTQILNDPKLRGVLRPLIGAWEQLKVNRRAALGVGAIGALAALSILLKLDASTAKLRREYALQVAQLQRIEAVAQEGDWTARAKDGARLLQAEQDRLWSADSDGVAQADLQDLLSGMGRDAALERFQVKVEVAPVKDLDPDYRQLTATITARATDSALVSLLDKMQHAPHLLLVQQMHLQGPPNSNLQVTVVAYARLTKRREADVK